MRSLQRLRPPDRPPPARTVLREPPPRDTLRPPAERLGPDDRTLGADERPPLRAETVDLLEVDLLPVRTFGLEVLRPDERPTERAVERLALDRVATLRVPLDFPARVAVRVELLRDEVRMPRCAFFMLR